MNREDNFEYAATLAGILQLRGVAFDNLQKKLAKHEWDYHVLLAYFCSDTDVQYSFHFGRHVTRVRMQEIIVAVVTRNATHLEEAYAWACAEADSEVTGFTAFGKRRTFYRERFIEEYMKAPDHYKLYRKKKTLDDVDEDKDKVHKSVWDHLKTKGTQFGGIGALLRVYMKMVRWGASKKKQEENGGDKDEDTSQLEKEVAKKGKVRI